LSARGHADGNGGTVSVTGKDADSDIVVGLANGAFVINATGGEVNSALGNGGTVRLTGGRSITVAIPELTAKPLTAIGSGSGANYFFEIGPCPGFIDVNGGDLNANAAVANESGCTI